MEQMNEPTLTPFGERILERLAIELATGPSGLAVSSRDGELVAVRADVVRQVARIVGAPLNAAGLRSALAPFVAAGTVPGRRASLEHFAERPRSYVFRSIDVDFAIPARGTVH